MRRWRFLPAVIAVPLLLAACGGDGDGGVATLGGGSGDRAAASPSVDPQEALVAWAECMREHGVDVPDPQVGGDGRITIGRSSEGDADGGEVRASTDPDEFGEADRECQHLLPEGGPLRGGMSAEEQAEMQDRMLEWAQCMREHGIDVPDPTFGEGGATLVKIGERGVDPDDDAFREAEDACGQPFEGSKS